MAFEEIKDQVRDKLQELKAQLEDSPSYNTLKEKFETLNPSAQKTIVWSVVVLVSLTLFSCPYSYWSTSTDYVAEYEETRDMVRDLLKASNLANQLGNLPPQINTEQLKTEVRRALGASTVLPDQVVQVESASAESFGAPLAPKSILQEGILVQLRQLNTRQIVEVGHRLQNLNASVKLAGLDLSVFAEDPRYYNADFRLVNFSLPAADTTAEEPAGRNRGRTRGNSDDE